MMKFTSPAAWAQERTPAQWANHHVRVVVLLIALAVLGSYPMGVFVLAVLTAPRPQAADARLPSGEGIVVSMNDTMGTISIQHSGVPQLNMAPGTTAFRAAAPIFKRTEVGDQLDFSLSQQDGVYVITSADNAVTGTQAAHR
jgi:Cu/Ag efflux protein CusF